MHALYYIMIQIWKYFSENFWCIVLNVFNVISTVLCVLVFCIHWIEIRKFLADQRSKASQIAKNLRTTEGFYL